MPLQLLHFVQLQNQIFSVKMLLCLAKDIIFSVALLKTVKKSESL